MQYKHAIGTPITKSLAGEAARLGIEATKAMNKGINLKRKSRYAQLIQRAKMKKILTRQQSIQREKNLITMDGQLLTQPTAITKKSEINMLEDLGFNKKAVKTLSMSDIGMKSHLGKRPLETGTFPKVSEKTEQVLSGGTPAVGAWSPTAYAALDKVAKMRPALGAAKKLLSKAKATAGHAKGLTATKSKALLTVTKATASRAAHSTAAKTKTMAGAAKGVAVAGKSKALRAAETVGGKGKGVAGVTKRKTVAAAGVAKAKGRAAGSAYISDMRKIRGAAGGTLVAAGGGGGYAAGRKKKRS